MPRWLRTAALAAVAALALGACGGDGDDGSVTEAGEVETGNALTQDQTAELLLTQEEFPVEGWTRGEVDQLDPDDAEETAEPENFEDMFEETEGIPQECLDALNRVGNLGTENVRAGSTVTFTGEESNSIVPAEAELVVAAYEGDSPLVQLGEVNEHCQDLEVTEQGMTMTLSFAELDGMDGTKMTMAIAGINVEMIMGGRSEGSNVVAVMASGLDESQVKEIVDLQLNKVTEAVG